MLTVHWKSESIFLTKDINDKTNQILGYDHTKPKCAGVLELWAYGPNGEEMINQGRWFNCMSLG